MAKVNIRKDEPIDKALRKFKRRLRAEGLKDEMRRREFYEKPSQRRRRKVDEARRRQVRRRRDEE